MPNLEKWSSREADDDQKVIYPRLELEVQNCPKMGRLPHLLPSLKELSIKSCPELVLPLLDGSQEQQPCPPLNSLKKLAICAS
ncbi:hypothetical protein MRB53_032760 [Persea americana]|uniref:Uncharacterized protein n=1 Tax=Persea americana TaxID=3435 RepID=A0ACC2KTA8_PERAE|nr:hypothetical protein MRB53_032760 [Persea americana]